MIRPVDIQVNMNALPEHARQNSAEQTGAVYRQGSEMNSARMENVLRPDRVVEAQAQSGLVFRPVNNKSPAVANQKRADEKEKAREKSEKYELYGPRRGRKKNLAGTESTIDFSA